MWNEYNNILFLFWNKLHSGNNKPKEINNLIHILYLIKYIHVLTEKKTF